MTPLEESRELLAIAEELASQARTIERSPTCSCLWKKARRVHLCDRCREQYPAYARVWESVNGIVGKRGV